VLRKVAADKLILMTSGGSDSLWPGAVAVRAEGGYRVTGRKAFCSQAPIANMITTMAAYDDPDEGRIVLAMGIPMNSPGVQIVETWDTLGMRGTASHDVQLDDVFVGDAQIAAKRPWGRWDPVMTNAVIHAGLLMSAVYHGIAAGARDEAVSMVRRRPSRDGQSLENDASAVRQIGFMDYKLKTSWWSLLGALEELGEDYNYAIDEQAVNAGLLAKRAIVTEAVEIVDIAMEVAGGASYFTRAPLERAYRDVRAGKYHPLPPEKTLTYAGRLALDLPVSSVW
jgi:acyl-CoA dehydrogenase